MTVRDFLKAIQRNDEGSSAVEFAIIAPVFLLLVLGTIGLCFALFLVGSLHFAVEDGARCAAVKTAICADAATTVTYTQGRYLGPNVSPTFTSTAQACGQSVSATVNYSMNIGFRTYVIPITATACYPS